MPEYNNKLNTHSDKNVAPGMLSSPHIEYYVNNYDIITGFDKSCLEPASYNMRVGGDVLTWHEGEKIEFTLEKQEDKNRNVRTRVELQPNSLTFLTTVEKFQLPKDIIARFNLKSKWVHQGLLLGTGPIVDPQLHAHLLIPVHNFSSQIVTMHYEEEFISVEFTKTLDPDSTLMMDNGNKSSYVDNEHWDFNFNKYRTRIANKKVESSVQSHFKLNNEQIELARNKMTEHEKTIQSMKNINMIGFGGVLLAIITLVLATWQLISSSHEKADAAYNLVKEYKESSVDFRSFALKSSYDDLQLQLGELHKSIEHLKYNSNLKSSQNIADFKADRARLEKQIKSISLRVKELEKSR